jgi:hypothetical protein
MLVSTMTRRVLGLVGLFCIGALLFLLGAVDAKPRRVRAKRASSGDLCKVDNDCALVVDGCCGCNAGGKQRAVLLKARPLYEKHRKSMCRQIMCPALMSEDASCVAGRAVCKDGGCTLGL